MVELIKMVQDELLNYDGKKDLDLYLKENPGWITITARYKEIVKNGIMWVEKYHEDFVSRILFNERIVYIKKGTDQNLWDIIKEIFHKLAWMDTANWEFKCIDLCSDMGITFSAVTKADIWQGTGTDGIARKRGVFIHEAEYFKGCGCCDDCAYIVNKFIIDRIKEEN